MFAKQYRLPANIKLEHPVLTYTPFCILKYAKNNLSYNRYGFIISKVVDKRATVRNRTKRRIRSCFEKMHAKANPGIDFLIIIKKEAVGSETAHIYSTIERMLLKERLLRQKN